MEKWEILAFCGSGIAGAAGLCETAFKLSDRFAAIRRKRRAKRDKNRKRVVAMRNLGLCYAFGIGVAANPLEAVAYFLKAAEAGDVVAMRNLGIIYADGRGVPKNVKQALYWFAKAEEFDDDSNDWGASVVLNKSLNAAYFREDDLRGAIFFWGGAVCRTRRKRFAYPEKRRRRKNRKSAYVAKRRNRRCRRNVRREKRRCGCGVNVAREK